MGKSTRYLEIRHQVAESFSPAGDASQRAWYRNHGRRWVRRVGLARLTAEQAVIEAMGLLHSINPSSFRNEPDTHTLLLQARDVVSDLGVNISRRNWRRFRGGDHV